MFGITTMKNVLVYGRLKRREPDLLNEKIVLVLVKVHPLNVTRSGLTKLIGQLKWQDGVLYRDGFEEEVIESVEREGMFVVAFGENSEGEVTKFLESSDMVDGVLRPWGSTLPRHRLKRYYPDKLEGHHFCSSCDEERESEDAFCKNPGCHLAVQNVRQHIQDQIDEGLVEADQYEYYCPDCEDTFKTWEGPDEDGEHECPECGEYAQLTDNVKSA